MTDRNEAAQDQPQKRGEAAWKAHKALIADRNQAARKASKEERRVHEKRIVDLRREAGS